MDEGGHEGGRCAPSELHLSERQRGVIVFCHVMGGPITRDPSSGLKGGQQRQSQIYIYICGNATTSPQPSCDILVEWLVHHVIFVELPWWKTEVRSEWTDRNQPCPGRTNLEAVLKQTLPSFGTIITGLHHVLLEV